MRFTYALRSFWDSLLSSSFHSTFRSMMVFQSPISLGFNNRAAILLFLAFTFSFALWSRGLGLTLPNPSRESDYSFRRTGQIAIACSILASIFVWVCNIPLGPIGEGQYFFDRNEMLRIGGHLYRDFSFDYGPLMFYPPSWIAHLFRLSLAHSYYIAWILQWALGTWTLWKTVQIATRGSRHGRTIFWLLWSFFLAGVIASGLNTTTAPLLRDARLRTRRSPPIHKSCLQPGYLRTRISGRDRVALLFAGAGYCVFPGYNPIFRPLRSNSSSRQTRRRGCVRYSHGSCFLVGSPHRLC